MNSKLLNSDKPETVSFLAKNAESSSTINQGNPVCFVMNATDDGLAVVLPATAAAAKCPKLLTGVALEAIAAGAKGRIQCFGFCTKSVVVRATRSASDADWASTAAGAVGDALKIQTADNAFVRASIPSSYVTGTAGSDTLALDLAMFAPFAVLAETLVSATTAASTSSGPTSDITVSTSLVKTFLRML